MSGGSQSRGQHECDTEESDAECTEQRNDLWKAEQTGVESQNLQRDQEEVQATEQEGLPYATTHDGSDESTARHAKRDVRDDRLPPGPIKIRNEVLASLDEMKRF